MDEDYIEVPWAGIFGVSDVDFDQMVKMDGKSMQNVCQVNREYSKFCSKDNVEFWASKYAYFSKGLDMPTEWKSKWIHLYQKVRNNPGKYVEQAIKKDKPSILVIVQKCNAPVSRFIIAEKMYMMKYRVADYLLSNIYTTDNARKRFGKWIELADDEWGMNVSLDFAKVLYKHGIILPRHMYYKSPDIKHFYIQEKVVNVSKMRPKNVEEFRDLKEYGFTWRNMFPYGLEDIFQNCDYEYINELFRDDMTLDDLRSADPYDEGMSVLTYNLGSMLYYNPGVGKKCANDILSKMRSHGLTKEELNEAYAYAHKLRKQDEEEEAVEAAVVHHQPIVDGALQELEDQEEEDEIEIGGDPDDLAYAEGQEFEDETENEDEFDFDHFNLNAI